MLSRSRMGAPQVGQAERGDTIGLASRHPVDHHVQERSDRETEEGTQPDQQSKHGRRKLRAAHLNHRDMTLVRRVVHSWDVSRRYWLPDSGFAMIST